jgi:CheY-like chemotaxis protein
MEIYPSLNLLIVDDIDVHRMLMRNGLSRINPSLVVSEASSVGQAKDLLLRGQHFNAVVCDRAMPGGDGTELVRWLRTMHCFDRTAIIMISGMIEPEEIISAFMESPIDGFVQKPFSHTDLYEKMMNCIEKRQAVGG